jgi:hypothetical protein
MFLQCTEQFHDFLVKRCADFAQRIYFPNSAIASVRGLCRSVVSLDH